MAEAAAEPQWDAAAGVWVGERAVGVSDDELPNPLWVFGYGSLCWRIDDPYEEIFDGKVLGWRRRMGQGSCDHRGTPELPGVVATLMPEAEWLAAGLALDGGAEGGAESVTHGVVYRVPEASAKEVIDNLDFREKGGYTKAVVDATSLDGSRSVRALIYTANSANPLFMGGGALQGTAPAEVAARIHRAVGPSGPNHEYLFALADYLRKVGANDPHVFGLEGQVKALRDADAAEGGAGGAAAAVGVSHTHCMLCPQPAPNPQQPLSRDQAAAIVVAVGSTNPVKLGATKKAFETVFPGVAFDVRGVSAASGVPDQPIGDEQTKLGVPTTHGSSPLPTDPWHFPLAALSSALLS